MARSELIVNSGSTSRKYGLAQKGELIAKAHLERGARGFDFAVTIEGKKRVHILDAEQRSEAPLLFVSQCVQMGIIKSIADITRVLFRIVAPSSYFASHRELTKAALVRLRALEPLAVSHIRATLSDIEDIQEMFEGRSMYAVSDSAFHRTIPEIARTYSIDPELAATHDVYRFGYHGLSVAGIVRERFSRRPHPERLVVVHVGGGASVTAVHDGLSVETSMGFMPINGAPMATRAHDLDVGGFIQLQLHSGEGTERLLRRLYNESGLINYSNIGHGGIKELLIASRVGNHDATQALTKYSYHMRKEIASQIAVLGGIDEIILTGTALLRSSRLRQLTLDGLKHVGVRIDMDKNTDLGAGEGQIGHENGPSIVVMETKEMDEMAAVAAESLN